MFSKSTELCLLGARRQGDKANSQFIMKVREEDRRDKILEDVFMRSTEENPYLKQIEANVALCTAIAEEKKSKQNAERRKMVRRHNNNNFRQLEYKLRAGYISKAVAAQRFEAEQLEVESKAKAHQENHQLLTARLDYNEYIKLDTNRRQQKKQALKSDLQAQMAYTEAKRNKKRLETIKDKQLMDEAVRQYQEDLLKNKQTLSQQKKRIRKEMEDYDALQAEWRESQKPVGVKERQSYEEKVAERVEGRRRFLQARQEEKNQKALRSEEMGKANHKIKEQKIQSLEFLIDLLVDERKANEDQKYANETEKKAIDVRNYRNDLVYLMNLNQRKRQEEKNQDDKLYQEGLRILAEYDAKQRIRDEERMMETKAHREALLNTLSEEKRFKVREMKRNLMAHDSLTANVLRRRRAISNARADLIQSHEPLLRGFLPPDVLREGIVPAT